MKQNLLPLGPSVTITQMTLNSWTVPELIHVQNTNTYSQHKNIDNKT